MTAVLKSLKAFLVGLLTTEPVLVSAAVVAVVGAVAGALGIVVDTASTTQIAAYVVVVLGSALGVRTQVSPKVKV